MCIQTDGRDIASQGYISCPFRLIDGAGVPNLYLPLFCSAGDYGDGIKIVYYISYSAGMLTFVVQNGIFRIHFSFIWLISRR